MKFLQLIPILKIKFGFNYTQRKVKQNITTYHTKVKLFLFVTIISIILICICCGKGFTQNLISLAIVLTFEIFVSYIKVFVCAGGEYIKASNQFVLISPNKNKLLITKNCDTHSEEIVEEWRYFSLSDTVRNKFKKSVKFDSDYIPRIF